MAEIFCQEPQGIVEQTIWLMLFFLIPFFFFFLIFQTLIKVLLKCFRLADTLLQR